MGRAQALRQLAHPVLSGAGVELAVAPEAQRPAHVDVVGVVVQLEDRDLAAGAGGVTRCCEARDAVVARGRGGGVADVDPVVALESRIECDAEQAFLLSDADRQRHEGPREKRVVADDAQPPALLAHEHPAIGSGRHAHRTVERIGDHGLDEAQADAVGKRSAQGRRGSVCRGCHGREGDARASRGARQEQRDGARTQEPEAHHRAAGAPCCARRQ